jgi:hypothetical protein
MNTFSMCRNFRTLEWHQKNTIKSRETIPLIPDFSSASCECKTVFFPKHYVFLVQRYRFRRGAFFAQPVLNDDVLAVVDDKWQWNPSYGHLNLVSFFSAEGSISAEIERIDKAIADIDQTILKTDQKDPSRQSFQATSLISKLMSH